FPRTISLVLAIITAALALLFTDFLSTALLVGLGVALVLLALWRYADRSANLLVLDVLAILTGLNVVFDLFVLVRDSDASMGAIRNDAAAFSAEVAPLLPGVVRAVLWAIIAVAMLLLWVYFSHVRGRRVL